MPRTWQSRYVFSEIPYAAALNFVRLKTHCSFCGNDATAAEETINGGQRRECDCDRVVYCSQSCMDDDRPFHRAECEAYTQGKELCTIAAMDTDVRMVGRMVARYRLDKGVVVLSKDFPSDMVKDRCFDDLMTHKRDLRSSETHMTWFKQTKSAFYAFFKDTDLATTPKSMVEKFYWRECINSFSLMVKMKDGTYASVGISLYLNASRFNHSCAPNGSYRFDGSRIVIEYGGNKDEYVGDPSPIRLSKDEFENLLISYGHSSAYMMSTCEQRMQSLKRRYFFTCRCQLCSNKEYNRMKLDSSTVECRKCKEPYLWTKNWPFGSMKLKQSCVCKIEEPPETKDGLTLGKKAGKEVKQLLKLWYRLVMPKTASEWTRDFVEKYDTVRILSDEYWHPRCNVRRAQFCEILYKAIRRACMLDGDLSFCGADDDFHAMLNTAEDAMRVYSKYLRNDCSEPLKLAVELVSMYKTRLQYPELTQEGDLERKNKWIKYALEGRAVRKGDGWTSVEQEEEQIESETSPMVMKNREEAAAVLEDVKTQ